MLESATSSCMTLGMQNTQCSLLWLEQCCSFTAKAGVRVNGLPVMLLRNKLNRPRSPAILLQKEFSMGIQVTDLHLLRDQLVVRRNKLEAAVARTETANLLQLLEQVDRALERVDHGSYGVCEACAGAVEAERLFADPLTQ